MQRKGSHGAQLNVLFNRVKRKHFNAIKKTRSASDSRGMNDVSYDRCAAPLRRATQSAPTERKRERSESKLAHRIPRQAERLE